VRSHARMDLRGHRCRTDLLRLSRGVTMGPRVLGSKPKDNKL
jgi:hypothetical protein